MKMKKFLLLFAVLLPLGLQAAEVSHERAAATALALMADRVEGFEGKVQSVKTVYYGGQKAYHVVQFAPAGWTLISADDLSDPLIGYSPDGGDCRMLVVDNSKLCSDRLVLHIAVATRQVQLVRTQSCASSWRIGLDGVPLIQKALVIETLEQEPQRFDVAILIGYVGRFHVDPVTHSVR